MKLIDLLVKELPNLGGWPHGSCYHLNSFLLLNKVAFVIENGHRFFQDCDGRTVDEDQYEAALAASQQTAWNGEGLPPVGITCEHCPGGATQHEWEIVTVIGISERPGGRFTDYWLRKEDGSSYVIGNPYRFRPIRTEAEIKRDKAIKLINDVFYEYDGKGEYFLRGDGVYDAIATGKIPGVKLE